MCAVKFKSCYFAVDIFQFCGVIVVGIVGGIVVDHIFVGAPASVHIFVAAPASRLHFCERTQEEKLTIQSSWRLPETKI